MARAPRAARRVVCLEWADPLFCSGGWLPDLVAIAGGGLAMLYTRMDNHIAVAVAIVATVLVFILGAFLFEGDISSLYAKFEIESDDSWAQSIRRYRSFGMMLVDVGLISAAYFGAYLIRFEGQIPEHQFDTFMGTLPIFLAGVGLAVSIVCIFIARSLRQNSPAMVLRAALLVPSVIICIVAYFLIPMLGVIQAVTYALAAGAIGGGLIGLVTEYYTAWGPIERIAESTKTGAGTTPRFSPCGWPAVACARD